jgi:hypothetical protein
LVVLPATAPRAGWEEAFAGASGEEEPLVPDGLRSRFDEEEWNW